MDAFRLDRGCAGAYAGHVLRNQDEFADAWGDIAPVTFACVAWRLAVATSPPYVRPHRRILDARCTRNAWDGGLTATVRIVSPLPGGLTRARDWTHDRGWREWPELFGQYVDPTEHDLARAPHLRASLLVEAPLPVDRLPDPPAGPDDDLAAVAISAVAGLVRELNDLLDPVLQRLDAAAADSPG